MTQHLLFDAGGLNLAVPANLVKAIHEELSIQSVAGTCSWFRGLAVAHGKLLPVTDVGVFAGRRSSDGRTLELDPSATIAGLHVDHVFGLSDQSVEDIPLTESEQVLLQSGNLKLSSRAIKDNHRTHRILDVGALVQSPEFLNIRERA